MLYEPFRGLESDDRTVSKCARLAKRWGYSAFYMLNAFALRATDNKELYEVEDPVGPENDRWIQEILKRVDLVVVGWGKPGGDFSRSKRMIELLREGMQEDQVRCFGHNLDGTPVHPLYQKEDSQLIRFFG